MKGFRSMSEIEEPVRVLLGVGPHVFAPCPLFNFNPIFLYIEDQLHSVYISEWVKGPFLVV